MNRHIEILEDVLTDYTFNSNVPKHLFINSKGQEKIFYINQDNVGNAILTYDNKNIDLGPVNDLESLRKNLYEFLLTNNIARKEDYIKLIQNNLLGKFGSHPCSVERYAKKGAGITVSTSPSISKYVYEIELYNVFIIEFEYGMQKNIYKEEYSNLSIETLLKLYYFTNKI